jgi:hypothetical protein
MAVLLLTRVRSSENRTLKALINQGLAPRLNSASLPGMRGSAGRLK